MNIAYLILAHNQPQQLLKLYAALNNENAFFYIHIDKKSSHTTEIINAFKDAKNVQVISVHKVYWMGFNMVQSTLELLKLAYKSPNNYKYFTLLSGQDYPIKSQQYINQFFERNTTDFISYNKIAHLADNYKKKYHLRHFYDYPYANPRDAGRKPFLVKMYYRLKKVEAMVLPKRKFYKDMVPYFGPQWFALTNETVKYILDFIEKDKGYSAFMKTTEGPDETFFQTLICNSDRKTNLAGYKTYLEWEKQRQPTTPQFQNPLGCLEFMDWSERGKSKPAVLDLEYFEQIKATPLLFARKFDVTISESLIKKIDEEILNT